jgi:hypothetical protein
VADSPEHKRHEATITTADPLGTPQDGMRITVSSLNISPVQAEASPLTVENYEYFDGALLTVCVQYGDTYAIEGTAVMIGLGLAISAKHVFDSHRAALNEGDAVLLSALEFAATALLKFGIATQWPRPPIPIFSCYL